MPRSSLPALALLALVAAACTPSIAYLRQVSVGHTGCPADEITISDQQQTAYGLTWVSSCRGHRFLCATVSTGKNDSENACKEELTPPR